MSKKYSEFEQYMNPGGHLINLDDEIKILSVDSSVEFVEQDYIVSIYDTIPNDSKFNLLWGLDNKKNKIYIVY